MKIKTMFRWMVSVFVILSLVACSYPALVPEDKGSDDSDLQIISVPGSGVNAEVLLSFSGMNISRAAGDWSGTIAVSGAGITGTYTAFIYRDSLASGAVRLILPVGEKTFSMDFRYERNNGVVDRYTGTASQTITTAANSVTLTLRPDEQGGSVDIGGINERPVYVTLIGQHSGNLITGAQLIVSRNGVEIENTTINATAQIVYLPVQGEHLADISDSYQYTVTHPAYATITGTLRVSMNEYEVDGVVIPEEHRYENFQKYMSEDTVAPVIQEVAFSVSNVFIYFDTTVTVRVTDNLDGVASVTIAPNGTVISSEIVNLGNGTWRAVFRTVMSNPLSSVVVTATDVAGNTVSATYSN